MDGPVSASFANGASVKTSAESGRPLPLCRFARLISFFAYCAFLLLTLWRLVPIVYNELRRLAHYHLRKERRDHTLQTTALVHEAYLCLVKQEPMDFENRSHFFGICANLMRQILVQYARRRKAAKRDAGYKLTVDDAIALPQSRCVPLPIRS